MKLPYKFDLKRIQHQLGIRWRDKQRAKVAQAVRKGILTKQPCEYSTCNEVKVHAHHYDYNLPLEVMWLCAPHHAELHKYYGKTPNILKPVKQVKHTRSTPRTHTRKRSATLKTASNVSIIGKHYKVKDH